MARILIIDDETQIRAMLRQMLERAGHDVAEAPDGKEGIRLHSKKPADLIVTDLIMPEKEGIETIVELRRRFPDVKIIAMSGGGRFEGPEALLFAAKSLGAARIFSKPIDRNVLLEAVRELTG